MILRRSFQNEIEPFSKHQTDKRHLFCRALKGKEVDFKPFINKVSSLSIDRIDEILDAVPFGNGRWNASIREHFRSVIENAAKLEIEFARSLL